MSDVFEDQRKFMRACGQTVDRFDDAQFHLYCDLIAEEHKELQAALQANNDVEALDALIDIIVVTVGAIHSLGADGKGAWKEVMRSNFAKVDAKTGKVRRREDGKILKPDDWQPPKLDGFFLPK